jgi:hypothetical protein
MLFSGGGSGDVFNLQMENGGVMRVFDGNGNYIKMNDQTLTAGNWHHVALVLPQSGGIHDIEFYLDGTASNESNVGNNAAINTGDNIFKLFPKLSGRVSDFRYYDYALTADEINDLFEEEQSTAPEDLTISTTTTSTADMVVNNLTVNAGTILTIDAGHTLTVNNDISNNGSIIVNSGGSLITFDGNTIGEVTIKRNTRYADGKYSFVGTPVVANASITGSDLGSTVYTYDETVAYGSNNGLDRWMDASSTPLTPGVGYAQAFQQEISFTGVPNDGTITVSGLTHTAPDAMHDEHGWQLLSNPYPAAIAVDKFLANATNAGSLNGSVYLWDDHGSETGRGDNGDYLTVNSLGAVGGPNGGSFNGYIGAMQGFFVKVASPTTGVSVEFTESMRVLGGNEDANFFRQIKEEPITVKLSIQTTDGLFNELLVGLTADATLGVDKKFDASKLVANQDLQFYSLMSGDKFAIQGLPVTSGVSTELGFDLGNSSDLTLKVQELNGLESEMTFFLHDTQTGNFYDLSEVSTVNFSAKAGSDQNRFKLIYSANGVLSTDLEIDQPVYRFTNNLLNVRFGKHTAIQGYAVYDMSGKVLHQLELKGKVQNEVNIPVDNKGLTIIRVITDMGMFTRKFIF